MLKKISTFDAVIVVLMAATGLAVKPVIGPIIKFAISPFLLSSGAISGIVYMVFPMLSVMVTRQVGSAALTGIIQGLIVFLTGIYGSHGILSIVTYTIPGLFIDAGYYLIRPLRKVWLVFLPTSLGNAAGNFLVGALFLRLPELPLIFATALAFVTGGFSGYLALFLYRWLINQFPALGREKEFLN